MGKRPNTSSSWQTFTKEEKKMKEKIYSEEEVIKLLDKREDFVNQVSIFDYTSAKEWFEQFKKK